MRVGVFSSSGSLSSGLAAICVGVSSATPTLKSTSTVISASSARGGALDAMGLDARSGGKALLFGATPLELGGGGGVERTRGAAGSLLFDALGGGGGTERRDGGDGERDCVAFCAGGGETRRDGVSLFGLAISGKRSTPMSAMVKKLLARLGADADAGPK
jgi:hypothetical protein